MRINPCHGCPLKTGCEQYVKFRDSVKSIGARSVTFRCRHIVDRLPRGSRVTMSMPVIHEMDWDGGRVVKMAMKATVLNVTDDGKFNAVMDKSEHISEDKFRWRKRKHVSRIISILDEPAALLCKFNNQIDEASGSCDRSDIDGGCWCANEKAAREWE